jgi:hypothetical protein
MAEYLKSKEKKLEEIKRELVKKKAQKMLQI